MARDVAWIAVVVVLILFLVLLIGGMGMAFGMMGPWMHGPLGQGTFVSPWWGLGMMLFWLLVIGGIVWLVTRIVREGGPTVARRTGAERALDILRERYARGEITRDQFEQMRRDLQV